MILFKIAVILFVRMWVEILSSAGTDNVGRSHPLREDVSWNTVNNYCLYQASGHPLREDVSWNAEVQKEETAAASHPLREDVSWNEIEIYPQFRSMGHPLREDVSWNLLCCSFVNFSLRHPLREDVSWNSIKERRLYMPPSSSSWGCELKWIKRRKRNLLR